MSDLASRYRDIQYRMEQAVARSRFHQKVTLIGVSKTQPAQKVAELYSLGQRDFGENYAQELIEKAQDPLLKNLKDLRWHFIGHLQSNKVKSILPFVSAIHSLDSQKLAEEISKRALALGRCLDCFIEVNLSRESTKSGILSNEVPEVVAACRDLQGIRAQGLMCIPSPDQSSELLRVSFAKLRQSSAGLPCLSMGMSDDFEIAIEEGATHIRVGTALFGPRPNHPNP